MPERQKIKFKYLYLNRFICPPTSDYIKTEETELNIFYTDYLLCIKIYYGVIVRL